MIGSSLADFPFASCTAAGSTIYSSAFAVAHSATCIEPEKTATVTISPDRTLISAVKRENAHI